MENKKDSSLIECQIRLKTGCVPRELMLLREVTINTLKEVDKTYSPQQMAAQILQKYETDATQRFSQKLNDYFQLFPGEETKLDLFNALDALIFGKQ